VRSDPTWGLIYQSRIDDQVKISGYRVELFEIEEALRDAAENPDVAVIPWPISEAGSASGVVAFVANLSSHPREVISRCRKVLPSYCVPKRIFAVDALPVNANGKVDRRALRLHYLESTNEG
jgi:acyl-coenzyme A synthetase/AMP-(fatty) acid ligase